MFGVLCAYYPKTPSYSLFFAFVVTSFLYLVFLEAKFTRNIIEWLHSGVVLRESLVDRLPCNGWCYCNIIMYEVEMKGFFLQFACPTECLFSFDLISKWHWGEVDLSLSLIYVHISIHFFPVNESMNFVLFLFFIFCNSLCFKIYFI